MVKGNERIWLPGLERVVVRFGLKDEDLTPLALSDPSNKKKDHNKGLDVTRSQLGVSDSESNLRKCKIRIQKKRGSQMAASMESANVSAEVKETLKVGNSIGFDMDDAGELTRKLKLAFLGIQETKKHVIDPFLISSFWGTDDFDFAFNPSNGKSIGILKVWDRNSFFKKEVVLGDGFTAIIGNWRDVFGDFIMVNVYAPQNGHDKSKLWKGTEFDPNTTYSFNKFIDDAELQEVVMGTRNFTSINKKGTKLSKLDRHKSVQESALLTKHLEELDLKAKIGVSSESDCNLRPRFHSNKFKKISELQKCFLERPFEYDEIKNAVWSCGEDAVFLKDLLNMMKLRMRSGAVEKTRRLVLMDSLS
ncbi:hypothetical protein Tco_0577907, partial [Tanacetum coccineum]